MKLLTVVLILIPLITAFPGKNTDEPASESSLTPSAILSQAEVDRETVVAGLAPLSFLVGGWKGVAQPKRGSNSGAWSEKASGVWHFDQKIPCLLLQLEPGEKSSQLFFAAASETGRPILELRQSDHLPVALEMTEPQISQKPESVAGNSATKNDQPQDHWIFESTAEPDKPGLRLTVRKISDIRMTMLFEERSNAGAAFRRQYEIGMTREGERLAKGNTGERQCIVTGGLGTIAVNYAGKVYYVCCEGCKQAFEADPDGTITAYRERLKANSL